MVRGPPPHTHPTLNWMSRERKRKEEGDLRWRDLGVGELRRREMEDNSGGKGDNRTGGR